MANPTVQWKGDNLLEVERLLYSHEAVATKHGDVLVITGEGLGIMLNLGDQLVLDGDQLGVIRPPSKVPDPEITWDGNNVFEMSRFLADFEVWCELKGNTLYIHDQARREKPACLNPGDKLINRNGMPVVSKAGVHHRLQ
jgi:hypothetical protein